MPSSSKHFFSDPIHLVNIALKATTITNPSLGLDEENKIIYIRPDGTTPTVSLLSGGGSGHEPSFSGLVGHGLLSACVSGTIFASPSAEQITTGLVARCDTEKGVLAIIMNYTGDVLNFGMGVEKAKAKGVKTEMVVVGDDVGVGREKAGKVGRRGIAGTVLVVKIAGAAAEAGHSLEEVKNVATKAAENLVSVAASLHRVHVPGRGPKEEEDQPLGDEEVELGMGIHNEPGFARLSVGLPKLVEKMLKQMLDQNDKDRAYLKVNSPEVVLLINNLGGISPLELSGVTCEVTTQLLRNYKIRPARVLSGTYMTSLNGLGFSITLLNCVSTGIPESMLQLLDAPAEAIGWAAPIRTSTWDAHNTAARDQPTVRTEARGPSGLKMDKETAKRMLKGGLERLIKAEPLITKYDTVVGDGDCGMGLKRGADSILKMIADSEPTGDVVIDVAKITSVIESTMDGTSGALYAIFMNSLISALQEQKQGDITPKVWADSLQKALFALEHYTPAKPGDRTLVDALEPFIDTLAKTGDVVQAAKKARAAAEGTKGMKASLGRTVYVGGSGFKEVPDPGAWGLAEFFLGMAGYETSDEIVNDAEHEFEKSL